MTRPALRRTTARRGPHGTAWSQIALAIALAIAIGLLSSSTTATALSPEAMAPTRLKGEVGRRAELVRALLATGSLTLPPAIAGEADITLTQAAPTTVTVPTGGRAAFLQVMVRHGLLSLPPATASPAAASPAAGEPKEPARDPVLDTAPGLSRRLDAVLGCSSAAAQSASQRLGCWIDTAVWAHHALVDGAALGARSQPLPSHLSRPTARQRAARARAHSARRLRAIRQVAALVVAPQDLAAHVAAWLDDLGVGKWSAYVALLGGLDHYRQLAKRPQPSIPTDFPVAAKAAWKERPLRRSWQRKITDTHRAALRARLCFEGYCSPDAPPPGQPEGQGAHRRRRPRRPLGLPAQLREQLRRYQRHRGLLDRGLTDAPTLAALRTTMADRVLELRLTLQRMRDTAAGGRAQFLIANIPAFRVDVWRNGVVTRTHRTQVGKGWRRRGGRWVPGHRTPLISERLRFLVLNPEWVVPSSIRREYRWKVKRDPDYFAKHGFELRTHANGGTTLVMKSGARNLLGRVKFLFPNPYLVYLHDTPTQWAFHRTRRTMSHGCVRVQDAQALARYLLSASTGRRYTPTRWDRLMARSPNKWKQIRTVVWIHLVYWTADVSAKHIVRFYPDVYRLNPPDFRAWRAADAQRLTGKSAELPPLR